MGNPKMRALIRYKKARVFKYTLTEDYVIGVNIHPPFVIMTDFIQLTPAGQMTIKKGYSWDGCSGPTHDDSTNQRGGLVHDALYQLFREEELDRVEYRAEADRLLRMICGEDGMNVFRRFYYWRGVRRFGEKFTHADKDKDMVYTAP